MQGPSNQTTLYRQDIDTDVFMNEASQIVVADIRHSREGWNENAAFGLEASSKEWDTVAMDIDYPVTSNNIIYLVLDTNVLISYLSLLRGFVSLLSSCNAPVILVIPGIVIQELNFLKEQKNTRLHQQLDISSRAREATRWLLASVRDGGRFGKVRGQKDNETPSGESWRIRRAGGLNDDVVLECCKYFYSRFGRAILFSGDVNLCLKSEVNDISALTPDPSLTPSRLLSSLIPQNDTDRSLFSSRWKSNRPFPYYKPNPVMQHDLMEIDGEPQPRVHPPLPPPVVEQSIHPLDTLHTNLLLHLSQVLPELVYRSAISAKQVEEQTSIHARNAHETIDLPLGDTWKQWTALECVKFASKLPPSKSHCPKLSQFLIPYGERGGRKGRQWTRGDWQMAIDELEGLANTFHWSDLAITVEKCRKYLDEAF